MRRRTYLALVGSVGPGSAAGCLSSPSRSTGSPTATFADCDANAPPEPETGAGLPDPQSYPERPDQLRAATARQFAEAYEHAYRFNSVLVELAAANDCVDYLDVHVMESTVERTGRGYRVTVTTTGSYTGTNCPGVSGTDTPTPPPHVDFGATTTVYLVTDDRLRRDGVDVACR